MKGIYNSRPPEPQCSTTWDVTTVLNWLKGALDLRFRLYIPEKALISLSGQPPLSGAMSP